METNTSGMTSAPGTAAERTGQSASSPRAAQTGAGTGAKPAPDAVRGTAAGNLASVTRAMGETARPGTEAARASQMARQSGKAESGSSGNPQGRNALTGGAPASAAALQEARQRAQAAISSMGERAGQETTSAQGLAENSLMQALFPYQQAFLRRQQAISSIHAGWNRQAQMTQSAYPGFQLQQEMRNPRFSKLLGMGVDVRTAYEAAHREEMLMDAMAYTADHVREMAVRDIQARGMRPAENGESGRGYAPYPSAVRESTRSQREAWEQEARLRKVVLR